MRGQQSAAGSAGDYTFATALNSVVPQPSVELQATRVAQLARELQQRQQVRSSTCSLDHAELERLCSLVLHSALMS